MSQRLIKRTILCKVKFQKNEEVDENRNLKIEHFPKLKNRKMFIHLMTVFLNHSTENKDIERNC